MESVLRSHDLVDRRVAHGPSCERPTHTGAPSVAGVFGEWRASAPLRWVVGGVSCFAFVALWMQAGGGLMPLAEASPSSLHSLAEPTRSTCASPLLCAARLTPEAGGCIQRPLSSRAGGGEARVPQYCALAPVQARLSPCHSVASTFVSATNTRSFAIKNQAQARAVFWSRPVAFSHVGRRSDAAMERQGEGGRAEPLAHTNHC